LSLSKNGPVYFSKYNVSETEFCLRLSIGPNWVGFTWRRRQNFCESRRKSSIGYQMLHMMSYLYNIDWTTIENIHGSMHDTWWPWLELRRLSQKL
jgi:hypothetical protein